MQCKKLVPEKCNEKKLSFVSFKLTVHKEFFDVYCDKSFWPVGVSTSEFIDRPPKSQQNLNSGEFRKNPFALSNLRHKNHSAQKPLPNSRTHTANTSGNRNHARPHQQHNGQYRSNNGARNVHFSHSNHRNGIFNGNSAPSHQKNRRAPFYQNQPRPNQYQAMHIRTQPVQQNSRFMVEEPLRLINQMMAQLSNLLQQY